MTTTTDEIATIRGYIAAFDFTALFTQALGWDHAPGAGLAVTVKGVDGPETYTLRPIATKRNAMVLRCSPDANGGVPNDATRRAIDTQVFKAYLEHLVIYTDRDERTQVWQWVRRRPGMPTAYRQQAYHKDGPIAPLVERLAQLAFDLDVEDSLTLTDVTARMSQAFDVDKVTKKFYDRFQAEHKAFLAAIAGVATGEDDRAWYASLMLNRLMFTYFIQKKGFLAGDTDYLRHKLERTRERFGPNQFHRFYREFLLVFFHDGLGAPVDSRSEEIKALIGDIPYLNGGLFELHRIEDENTIAIPDAAFERVFAFFDAYQWHLDDRPSGADNEINPDVLGYIFEKYINQKQMGAYYTKEDITGYISRNTIIPFLLESVRAEVKNAFDADGEVWRLLRDDPDQYIYEAVRRGVDADLPEDIAAGVEVVAKRGGWNRPTPRDGSRFLPTETWREHVARRQRCHDLRAKLAAGEVHEVNDLITYNLDSVRFARDVIERCESVAVVRAFWKALERVSVLDPTCGSGAFLFAALRILEPLYDACLARMAAFVAQFDREGQPRMGPDFRETLADVARHPSRAYFIRKRIILRNLYGVDIMEEAVEIAKLRLFLALVSQAPDATHIEPLPDIDFNIRAGNTLVGFATLDEAERAVSSHLFWREEMPQIKLDAEDLARAFALYRERQQGMESGEEVKAQKASLNAKLSALASTLDRFLASGYGKDESHYPSPGQLAHKLAVWRASHQPFHWFIEFYEIIQQRGGFDVIIGNPPWKEYSAVRQIYTVQGYQSDTCGNLYGICTERILRLRAHGQPLDTDHRRANLGRVSFIVQLPLVNSSRMVVVRNLLRELSAGVWVVPFDDRPGKLFEGLQHCRSAIFVSEPRESHSAQATFTAKYQRWAAEARATLISSLELVKDSGAAIYPDQFPKYASPIEDALFARIASSKRQSLGISLHGSTTLWFVFYQEATQYWTKACVGLPYYAKDGAVGAPDHGRYLYVSSEDQANALGALLNSSLFYTYFVAYGDCFHLSDTLVAVKSEVVCKLGSLVDPRIHTSWSIGVSCPNRGG